MSGKFNFLIIYFLWSFYSLQGQGVDIRFDNLSKEDGLSYSLVKALVQDNQGYMWIGTQDGLNRYDGYDFKIFRPNAQSNSIYHQSISFLYKDRAGRIWIRYLKEGLSYYNPNTERFHTFLHQPGNEHSISSDLIDDGFISSQQLFHEDKNGQLWIGTELGLNKFRPTTKDFEQIDFESLPNHPKRPSIIAITSDQNGNLIIGTSKGLIRYQPDTRKATVLLSSQYITQILIDGEGIIWAGTRQKGLYKIELNQAGKIKKTTNYVEALKLTSSEELSVMKIYKDEGGSIWFGTSDGLFVLKDTGRGTNDNFKKIALTSNEGRQVSYLLQDIHGKIWASSTNLNILWNIDPSSLKVQSYSHSSSDKNSLGPNRIQALFQDNTGVLWIGLEKGGVSKVNLFNKAFLLYHNNKKETSKIPNNDTYAIYVDDHENLWIGTHDGLYRKDGLTGEQKVFKSKGSNFGTNYNYSAQPSGKLVGTIEPASDGSLWLGYFDYKISNFNPQTGLFKNFQHNPGQDSSFSMWSMRDIFTTSDGSIFFAGTSNGLGQLLPDGEHFKYYSHDKNDSTSIPGDWIYVLHQDKEGTLWLGTKDGGLAQFDMRSKQFKSYQHSPSNPNSLSNNTVKCILEQDGPTGTKFWLGTEGGINLFDPQTETFQAYTTKDGLPSNNIHGILEDQNGQLWISSNGGLSCFDPKTKKITNYNKEDGLQGNEFNQGSYFKDAKGQLYFGGLDGVTVFHPDSLKQNPFTPKLMITDFFVNNKIVTPGDDISGQIILDDAIGYTNQITLGPKQKVISFSFAAFHYAAPSKIKYRYKLEPFETKWNERGSENRFINYTNILPGDYQLHIECSSIEGEWGADLKILKITVLPPFWKKLWFKALILFFILFTTLRLIHLRTKGLAKQKKALIQQVKERTSELELKSQQLEQTNLELKARQEEVVKQNKKIAEQRDHLENHNQELIQQKKETIWMAEKLHESDQSKLNFFTNISHEFRTPLSLIIGPTESLLNQPDFSDTEKVKESLSLMYRSEKRLLRLINQLLEIRRVESGTLEFNAQQMDIILFSRELLTLFQPRATRKQISINFKANQDKIQLSLDPDKLEKILFNLLSNAFKHTPNGGKITLSIKESKKNKEVTLYVTNSGKGIPEKNLSQIFDRFFHADHHKNSEELSFGIGLSLVKDLVELHQGKVSVELNDEGTCFKVSLPIHGLTDTTLKAIKPEHFSFSKSMIGRADKVMPLPPIPRNTVINKDDDTPIILIVEDNPDMLRFLSNNLHQKYKILTAENGNIGIKLAFKHIPDLIISDIMMPELDGLELTETLKKDPRSSHIPILLLTAKAGLPSQIAGLQSGADAYLTKPFNLEALELKLKNMLQTRQNLIDSIQEKLPSIPKHVNVRTIDQGLLQQIIEVIEKNIDDDSFNGDRLARAVGMSKGSLYRKLKGLTGMTVNIFIRTFRLKVAAQLLQKGNCNISEVAYAVGFDNPKYFSVCFKQLFNQTPRAYMNAHAE